MEILLALALPGAAAAIWARRVSVDGRTPFADLGVGLAVALGAASVIWSALLFGGLPSRLAISDRRRGCLARCGRRAVAMVANSPGARSDAPVGRLVAGRRCADSDCCGSRPLFRGGERRRTARQLGRLVSVESSRAFSVPWPSRRVAERVRTSVVVVAPGLSASRASIRRAHVAICQSRIGPRARATSRRLGLADGGRRRNLRCQRSWRKPWLPRGCDDSGLPLLRALFTGAMRRRPSRAVHANVVRGAGTCGGRCPPSLVDRDGWSGSTRGMDEERGFSLFCRLSRGCRDSQLPDGGIARPEDGRMVCGGLGARADRSDRVQANPCTSQLLRRRPIARGCPEPRLRASTRPRCDGRDGPRALALGRDDGRRAAGGVRAPAHQRYSPVQRRGCHRRMARHGGDGCRLCSGVPGEPAGSRLAASNVTGSRRTAARTDNRMGRHDGGAMTRWRIG